MNMDYDTVINIEFGRVQKLKLKFYDAEKAEDALVEGNYIVRDKKDGIQNRYYKIHDWVLRFTGRYSDQPISALSKPQLGAYFEIPYDEEAYTHSDFAFDFKDENGELVMPFTINRPLYTALCPYSRDTIFTNERGRCKTFKSGFLSNEVRKEMCKYFSDGLYTYDGGNIIMPIDNNIPDSIEKIKTGEKRMRIQRKTTRKLNEIIAGEVSTETKIEELRVLIEKNKEDIEELWKPDGIICRFLADKFKENANSLEDL